MAAITGIDNETKIMTLSSTIGNIQTTDVVRLLYNCAIGKYSHVEGSGGRAVGLAAHTEGTHTVATSDSQHTQGKYNVADSNSVYADIIGNGTADNARSNAYALDWQGNAYHAGNVFVSANSDSTGGEKLARETIIAPEEVNTASKAYNVGDLFLSNGHLYKVTVTMA